MGLTKAQLGVRHRNVRYNARVLCSYKKVYCIRPKTALANDGLYREARHFTAWSKPRQVETYYLESVIQKITGQKTVPIGDLILSTPDTAVTCESCEEMFVPLNSSIFTGLNGVSFQPSLCYDIHSNQFFISRPRSYSTLAPPMVIRSSRYEPCCTIILI